MGFEPKEWFVCYIFIGMIMISFFFTARALKYRHTFEEFGIFELFAIYVLSIAIWPVIMHEIYKDERNRK